MLHPPRHRRSRKVHAPRPNQALRHHLYWRTRPRYRRSSPLERLPLGECPVDQLLRTRGRVRLRIIVDLGEFYANQQIVATGDVPAVLAGMDPKIEWTEAEGWPLYSGTLVGPQAIVDGVFMRLGEIGDNLSLIHISE